MELSRLCWWRVRDYFNLELLIFVYEIVLFAANLLMADYHSVLMRKGRPIKHGWWALSYLILTAFLAYLGGSYVLAFVSVVLRKVVFDTALNIFNDRPLFFVSTETTSIIDRLHYWAFGKNSEIYMILYILILIVLNIWMAH